MSETDLRQRDLGPLRAAAEAAELAQAVSGLVSINGYRLAGSDPLAPLAPRYRPLDDRGGPAPSSSKACRWRADGRGPLPAQENVAGPSPHACTANPDTAVPCATTGAHGP
jgi:hypothetical protein